jgi:hypothetical protein
MMGSGGKTVHDEIVVFEVTTETLDGGWHGVMDAF